MGVTDRVRTGRCNLELFRGGLKVNHNIGNVESGIAEHSCISNPISYPKPPSISEKAAPS
jgi:hypothetical protein